MDSKELIASRIAVARTERRKWMVMMDTVPYFSDPISVYRKVLSRIKGPAALMESAKHGVKDRYSYICFFSAGSSYLSEEYMTIDCAISLESFKGRLRLLSPAPHGDMFVGGAVGFIGHEAVSLVEKTVLPNKVDPFRLPQGCFHFFRKVIIFDHEERVVHFVVNLLTYGSVESIPYRYSLEQVYKNGEQEIARMKRLLQKPELPCKEDTVSLTARTSNMTKGEYCAMVKNAKELIRRGEIFQVVLSQRFSVPYQGDGLNLYSILEKLNPSPNMFHMRFGPECRSMVLLGSSPEIMVSINPERVMRIRPIAGTRKRGATIEEDKALATELLADQKELAEHRMLVDLARNDIGKQCVANSIVIPTLMKVENYSHVMHIVTEVTGRLRAGVHPFDACIASLPAGTLSGAPKIRALRIISDLELSQRGPYGGAFGWVTDTAVHTCILIRFAMRLRGTLYWQSGGGIVSDSVPSAEYEESNGKARAIATALDRMGGSNDQ